MVRGPVSMVIVGAITLVMFALVSGGPRIFDKVLPEGAVAWLETMGGLGGMVGMSGSLAGNDGKTKREWGGETAESHVLDGIHGLLPTDQIAAAPAGGAVFIADVIAGHDKPDHKAAPARVDALVPVAGCSLTPPSAGAVFGHVNAMASSEVELDLATYGDADLARGVRDLARLYRDTGTTAWARLRLPLFDSFDVVVTETAAPVYLVLETGVTARIWNIHLAPGARVERVVLLGGRHAGVAHLPEDVPVEVLSETAMADCAIPGPAFPLNPNHAFNRKLAAGSIDPAVAEQTLAELAAVISAYDSWFRQTFGQGGVETAAGGWSEGTIAAIGPVPATPEGRVTWASVNGAVLRSTIEAYVEYPALVERGADYSARVKAIATAFAWGDLGNIRQGEAF